MQIVCQARSGHYNECGGMDIAICNGHTKPMAWGLHMQGMCQGPGAQNGEDVPKSGVGGV